MKKVIILLAILCFAIYLLLKEDAAVNLVVEQVKEIQHLSIFSPNPNSASEKIVVEPEQLNSESATESRNYILECKNELDSLANSDEDNIFLDPDLVRQALKIKNTYSAKLAYALSSVNESVAADNTDKLNAESSVSLLIELLDEWPNNNMLNYFLVAKCNEEKNEGLCSDDLISNATDSDFNNGAIWLQVAAIEAGSENISGVISALEQVISTSDFNSYWAESIELFNEAQQSIGFDHEQSRMVASIGYAAAISIGPIQDVFKVCEENATTRADLAQICIDAGKRLAASGKILIYQALGFGLQTVVHKALGNTENELAVARLSRENMQMTEHADKASQLMLFDLDLSHYWFEQLKLFGEKESFRLLTEEAIRLSSNPKYNPCAD